MITKRHGAYFFFNINEIKFLKDSAWFCRTQASHVQMAAVPTSVESKRDFSFARMNSCVAVGHFTTLEGDLKCQEHSVFRGLQTRVTFPVHCLKPGGTVLVSFTNAGRLFYILLHLVPRRMITAY